MEKVVLAFLIGAAVGIGAYVAFSGAGSEADLEPRHGGTAAPADIDSSLARRDGGGVGRTDLMGMRSGTVPAIPPLAPIRAAAGDAVIRGSVVDENGDAVAEVVIEAEPIELAAPAEAPLPDDVIEVWLEKSRRLELARRALRARVVSDADGRFALEGLDDEGRYLLRARRPGWVIAPPPGSSFGVRPGEEVVLAATRGTLVTFDVRDEDGAVPPDATVVYQIGEVRREFPWTASRPTLTLENGAASIAVRRGRELRASSQKVELDGEPQSLHYSLRRVPVLRGSVEFEGPRPDHLTLRWLPLTTGLDADHATLTARGFRTTITASQGFRFDLGETPPGPVAIAGYGPKDTPLTRLEIVQPEAGGSGVTVHGLVPRESDYIVIRAYDPEGRVLRRIGFSSLVLSPGGYSSGSGTALECADGSFWYRFGRDDGADAPDRRPFVRVTSNRYGTLLLPAPPGTRQLTAQFREPAAITVELEGGSPDLVRASRVGVRPLDEVLHRGVEAVAASGIGRRWSAERIQPGRVMVEVWTGARQWDTALLAAHEVEIGPGANLVTLALPEVQDLDVHVVGAEAGTRVLLRDDSGTSPRRGSLDGEGHVRFSNVGRGRYTIDVLSPGRSYASTSVAIPGPRDLVIRPR